MAYAIEVVGARGAGQDRARVIEHVAGVVVALADGAGGTSHGARAAQALVDAVDADVDPVACIEALDRDPARLGPGQTTAVIVDVRDGVLAGASVGDSGAWLVDGARVVDLTDGQARKPLVGAGCTARRIPAVALGGATLLVASDGLLRYATPAAIARAIADATDLATAAHALVALVRLPTGALQDDVSIVLVRQRTSVS